MLCEECRKREANTHIKRTVNGKSEEHYLCSECARNAGYDSMLTGFLPNMNSLFGGLLSNPIPSALSNPVRCPFCKSSYNDIVKTGMVGCAECYKTFYKELLPSIRRIHGNTVHSGKKLKQSDTKSSENELESLKKELECAINEQEFEHAAQLRDKIKLLSDKGGL